MTLKLQLLKPLPRGIGYLGLGNPNHGAPNGPMHGYTVLGDAKAELTEGYAMPIPPDTRHGYSNIGTLPHHVPFIFGSLTTGGWGVFLDVEPQPIELDRLETTTVLSNKAVGWVMVTDKVLVQALASVTVTV